jgi:hypothetical protein
MLLPSEFNLLKVKLILTTAEIKIRRRSGKEKQTATPIFQGSNPSCDSPFLVTCKLSILNGRDPLSLA